MTATWRILTVLVVAALAASIDADEPRANGAEKHNEGDLHVRMHKNPGCGCCDVWADHMREHGFTVVVTEDPKIFDLKENAGIPQPLFSCHTAFVDSYFIEGHVPAKDILSLLRLKPAGVAGLAVPGMPLGSPGMEHPRPQSFNTVALLNDGDAYVFAKHEAGEKFTAGED